MSFGAAGSSSTQRRAPRALAPAAPCPCGSGNFGECCGPLLAGASAATPEQLMRSRFTAFAIDDVAYVRTTWHPTTVPDLLDLDDELRWTRLELLHADSDERRGIVEFRAHWAAVRTGESGVLHEVSQFRRAAGRWYYVDGDIVQESPPSHAASL